MIASRQVEIPVLGGIGRQRGRGFRALAHFIGRTLLTFLRKFIVPAAKRLGADLLQFAVPENADVFSARKDFKTAAKSLGRQTLKKLLGSGSRKKVQAESLQQNLQNKPVSRKETFSQRFIINHIEYFSMPTFCDSFWKSWRESPSSWRSLVVPRTRNLFYYLFWWKLHRVWISNGSELLRWFETEVVGFESEICRGSWLRNYTSEEVKREQK